MTEPTQRQTIDHAVGAVYQELRRVAAAYLRREHRAGSLQPTVLVHEAYLRLADADPVWADRAHFLGIAARCMRQVLVDRARSRGAQKRWAGLERVSLTESLVRAADQDEMLPALDDALERLAQLDAALVRLVEFRFFVGLSVDETAEAMGISPATVKRRWAYARAWLFRDLTGGNPS